MLESYYDQKHPDYLEASAAMEVLKKYTGTKNRLLQIEHLGLVTITEILPLIVFTHGALSQIFFCSFIHSPAAKNAGAKRILCKTRQCSINTRANSPNSQIVYSDTSCIR